VHNVLSSGLLHAICLAFMSSLIAREPGDYEQLLYKCCTALRYMLYKCNHVNPVKCCHRMLKVLHWKLKPWAEAVIDTCKVYNYISDMKCFGILSTESKWGSWSVSWILEPITWLGKRAPLTLTPCHIIGGSVLFKNFRVSLGWRGWFYLESEWRKISKL